jgi:predicted RNA-binding protein with PIN domain
MHYYLDGYNILFSIHDEETSFNGARDQLILQLSAIATTRNHPITVVFDAGCQDGIISRRSCKDLEIIFSSEGQDADSCLIELMEAEPFPARTTLVSSDRFLCKRAREHSIKTMTSETFLLKLQQWEHKSLAQTEKSELLGDAKTPFFDYYLEEFEKRLDDSEE